MRAGRAIAQTINSQKMFLTVFSLAILSFIYFRLDNNIIVLIEEGNEAAKERTLLFKTFAEYITILVLGFYSVNTMQKGKWFNNQEQTNNNEPE
jgi:hypothetical protein